MSEDFGNPYPREFGHYRIGTPINADLGRANPACPAFEMGLLAAEHCLLMDVNPTSTKRIQGSGSDTKSQDAWAFSSDSSVRLSWFVNASLSCHVNRSSNVSKSRSSQTITAFAKQESGIELRQNVPSHVLLSCATEDFRARLKAIRAAALQRKVTNDDGETLRAAFNEFYRVYGTGFVSKLVLGAVGVFRGSATYESTDEEIKSNYGGGASVSGFDGGASVAVEYTKNCMNAEAAGSFQAEAFGMPPESGAVSWVEGFMNQFAGQQLAELKNLQAWKQSFEHEIAHATPPEIKERPKPPEEPSFVAGDVENQINDMKLKEFARKWRDEHHNQEPPAGQYDQWIQSLKSAAASASPASIARAAAALPAAEQLSTQGTQLFTATATPHEMTDVLVGSAQVDLIEEAVPSPDDLEVHGGYVHATALQASAAGAFNDVDFGSYGVVGYEYTPWDAAFPELKPLRQDISASQLAMGFAMAWLSTREVIAQYLKYCAKFFPDVAPEGTSAAANAYRAAMNDISAYVIDSFSGSDSSGISLPRLESRFRNRLAARKFTLMKHYDLLIENYEWFSRVPFGATAIVEVFGRYYYQPYETALTKDVPVHKSEFITNIECPAATLLERGALRLYPIIATDNGQPFFFWTNVENISLGGKALRVGASLFNSDVRGPFLPDWGMCRVLGPNATPGALAEPPASDKPVPRIRISREEYGKSVWRLRRETEGAKCLLFAKGDKRPFVFAKDRSQLPPDLRLVLCGEVDPTKHLANHANVFLGTEQTQQHFLEVGLVPIDYADAKIAAEPARGFKGGGPMWFEPRTDRIIDALNALG